MNKIWVVIDEGCQECSEPSKGVGVFPSVIEAAQSVKRYERANGYTDATKDHVVLVYPFDLDTGKPIEA